MNGSVSISKKSDETKTRAITGTILVAIVAAITSFFGLGVNILLAVLIAGYEQACHLQAVAKDRGEPGSWTGAVFMFPFLMINGFAAVALYNASGESVFVASICTLMFTVANSLILIQNVTNQRPNQKTLGEESLEMIGLVGIFMVVSLASVAGYATHHPYFVVAIAAMNFLGGDTCAYFVGRAWGKGTPKLCEAVSPNKTRIGSFGGICGSIVIAALAWGLWPHFTADPQPALWVMLLIGFVVAILNIIGDLGESAYKRGLGIKDSGTLLPGHGGMLDRIDGLLLSLPGGVLLYEGMTMLLS